MNTRSPKRLCRHPGCRALHVNRGGYCDEHQYRRRQTERQQDRDARGSASERGYDHTWHKVRRQKLNADPLCERCEARDKVIPAAVVHHIDRNPRNNAEDNLESLCRPCHDIEHSQGRQGSTKPDWLPKPNIPVVIVSGPPGSGKTTYARAQAGNSDVVIDLDDIGNEIAPSRRGNYHDWDRRKLGQALYIRNARLADLSRAKRGKAYLILTAPRRADRQWWIDKLNAQSVVMATPADVCIERLRADGRADEEMKNIVRQWWFEYQKIDGEKTQ